MDSDYDSHDRIHWTLLSRLAHTTQLYSHVPDGFPSILCQNLVYAVETESQNRYS